MKSEQESVMDINLKSMNEFMVERGWKSSLCKVCNSTFFFKPSTDEMDVLICGRHKCDNRRYSFRSYSRNKRLLTPSQINIKLREYFCSAGFGIAASKNIVNFEGQTDLIIAGVQMFDDIIHHDEIIRDDKVFVAQPCVRMQFQPQVGSQEGISTSFVNVCTEKMMSNFAEHLQSVDHWLTVLSKIGLHMNNFIIASRTSVKDWGTGKFLAGELFFSYGGLELGDATYLLIPQANRAVIPISDIGFGLERIAWAINKTDLLCRNHHNSKQATQL